MGARKIQQVNGPRVETGALQFGDDWPGIFIRGDEALGLAHLLDMAIDGHDRNNVNAVLRTVVEMLLVCRVKA